MPALDRIEGRCLRASVAADSAKRRGPRDRPISGTTANKEETIMPTLLTRMRLVIGAVALAFIVACAAPVSAQQRNPDNSVNPTASSVKEDQLLNELNRISGRCTLPDQKACTIEQPAGRDWRHF